MLLCQLILVFPQTNLISQSPSLISYILNVVSLNYKLSVHIRTEALSGKQTCIHIEITQRVCVLDGGKGYCVVEFGDRLMN